MPLGLNQETRSGWRWVNSFSFIFSLELSSREIQLRLADELQVVWIRWGLCILFQSEVAASGRTSSPSATNQPPLVWPRAEENSLESRLGQTDSDLICSWAAPVFGLISVWAWIVSLCAASEIFISSLLAELSED